ncbi:MAG: hypothetical protein V2A74_07330 [bacterium]
MSTENRENPVGVRSAIRDPLVWILFALLFVTYGYFFHREAGWNVNSRMDLTLAIVDQGTLNIDYYHERPPYETGDKAYYDGHFYCDKTPGLSFLGVPVYWVLRKLSLAWDFPLTASLGRYVTRLLTVSLCSAALGVVFFLLAMSWGASRGAATFATLTLNLCTLVLPYATIFYAYGPALLCVVSAYLIMQCNVGSMNARRLLCAGLLMGLAQFFEYTLGLVNVALFVYIVYRLGRMRTRAVWLIVGGAVPMSAYAIYTYSIFGAFAIPYQYEVSEFFRENMQRGFQGIGIPKLGVFLQISVLPYRGIFFQSPVLLFSLLGFVWMGREARFRADQQLGMWILVAYFLFNSSYFLWWGGWAPGARHLLPAIPFLVAPLLWVWRRGRGWRVLLICAAVYSFVMLFVPTAVDPQVNQGYQTSVLLDPGVNPYLRSPVLVLSFPAFYRGEVAWNFGQWMGLKGLWSLVPLVAFWGLCGVGISRSLREEELQT